MPRIELIHGNSIELMTKMTEGCIDLVVTDPPYRIITGGDCGDRPKGMLSGNRKLFEHQTDIEICEWMPLLYKVLKPDTHAYIFTNFKNLREMMEEADKAGFKMHNLLVWEKNNCTPSQFYMKNCEYVLFLRKGKAKWINDIGGSKTVHKFNNIIGNKTHPCEKPADLLKFYINNSSNEGTWFLTRSWELVLAALLARRQTETSSELNLTRSSTTQQRKGLKVERSSNV